VTVFTLGNKDHVDIHGFRIGPTFTGVGLLYYFFQSLSLWTVTFGLSRV